MSAAEFTIGIEEEYLLVDPETGGGLAAGPPALFEACAEALGDQVSPEFLQCQIEVGTKVCRTIAEAREDLGNLRRTVARIAGDFGLAPIAVSCHPFADWKQQHHTDKERYNALHEELGGVARRLLTCGMHVHVGIAEPEARIDLVNQLSYFLPHLLALSGSSPFWQGNDTKLSSYRLTVFDNLPRTGLPPQFGSWAEYQRTVGVLIDLGVIEDTSKIWWDLRPSARFPTIESRITDVQPRMEHALTLAALVQATARMLTRLRQANLRWRLYDAFLINENRWRAIRFGGASGLIDFGRREIVPMEELLDEWIGLIEEDAVALRCLPEVLEARQILAGGTSAERQRSVLKAALDSGATRSEALTAVVEHLGTEFHADL